MGTSCFTVQEWHCCSGCLQTLEGIVSSTTFVSVVMPYLNIYKRTAKLGMTLTIPEAGLCKVWVGNAYDYIACLRAGPFPLSVHPRFSISH